MNRRKNIPEIQIYKDNVTYKMRINEKKLCK